MDCKSCKEKKAEPVPYIVHEGAMARQERANKRLWIVVILLIGLLVASNASWLWYESQFEDVTTTTQEVEQTTDGGGSNSFVGGDVFGSTDGSYNHDQEARP